ncbi:MAG: RNA polymerase factor sigma-54 [Planctomycetota bacterium]
MSLDLRLGQRQEQRLALLPQMLQSIEVLQLATTDLVQFLEAELQQNETLELHVSDVATPGESPPTAAAEERAEDSGWQDDPGRPVSDGAGGMDSGGARASSDADDAKLGFLANLPAASGTLRDSVREQLTFQSVPPLLAEVVLLLVDRLDERGLLSDSDAEVAAAVDLDEDIVGEARLVLHGLEPGGLGAQDGIDAMLLQAASDPDLVLIAKVLREHLDALGKNKLPEVARALELSIDELEHLLARIRDLNPRPASAFSSTSGQAVRPDAYAWLRDGGVQVVLDDEALPDLHVNEDYAALAGDRRTEREVRDYLRPKLRSARELIDAIQQRQATLRRVVEAVMRQQRAFLERGRAGIRPLRMSEVADELELHTSTVSRTIAGKYVQTDRGVFALRDFFDGGRIGAPAHAGTNGGEGQGRMAVAQQIADLVAGENKSQPMSDDELVQALKARGVQVARRTVAKYRRELGIVSSYQRRKYTDSK